MAHKKAGGSSRNGRDSVGRRLGVKKFGSEGVVESENGIGWSGLEVFEHQLGPGSLVEPVGW